MKSAKELYRGFCENPAPCVLKILPSARLKRVARHPQESFEEMARRLSAAPAVEFRPAPTVKAVAPPSGAEVEKGSPP